MQFLNISLGFQVCQAPTPAPSASLHWLKMLGAPVLLQADRRHPNRHLLNGNAWSASSADLTWTRLDPVQSGLHQGIAVPPGLWGFTVSLPINTFPHSPTRSPCRTFKPVQPWKKDSKLSEKKKKTCFPCKVLHSMSCPERAYFSNSLEVLNHKLQFKDFGFQLSYWFALVCMLLWMHELYFFFVYHCSYTALQLNLQCMCDGGENPASHLAGTNQVAADLPFFFDCGILLTAIFGIFTVKSYFVLYSWNESDL